MLSFLSNRICVLSIGAATPLALEALNGKLHNENTYIYFMYELTLRSLSRLDTASY